MIAQSQSGTGKTAAFVLSMLSRVDTSKPYPQVIGALELSFEKVDRTNVADIDITEISYAMYI